MSNKIIFGSDLIDVLENKYNMNKLGEVPTKYKNGITIIDFIYGKEKDIDDLKYNKPYVEFSIDDETDGFISGTMYLNGGVEGIQFDSWEDLKYFVKNAKWTESEKYTRKSIKENLTRYDMIGQGFFVFISNISFGLCEQLGNKTQDTHWIRSFDTEKQAINFANKKGYPIVYEKFNESKKSMKKSLKESVDGYIATDEDCNMSGEGWVLDGSYNFIMEFLQEWGIAPKNIKVKNGMTTLYNADGKPFGYVYQDGEVDIFVADKTINWTWKNHNPSTKHVKVTALDEIF